MIVFLQILVAAAICIYGVILLVRLLKNMEKDLLESWLGFLKFFLGTFVIGLLGFFAKVSYENRQMAVNEAAQIGNYVKEATASDMEKRIQFAEYFSTVLPEGHNSNWDNYHQLLLRQQKLKDSLQKLVAKELDTVEETKTKTVQLVGIDGETGAISYEQLLKKEIEELSAEEKEYIKKIEKALQDKYDNIDKELKEIKQIDNAYGAVDAAEKSELSASVNEFVTCTSVKNRLPYGRTTSFKPNDKVYVHAYVKSSKNQQIEIIWRNGEKVLKNKLVDIGVNLGRGYRVYDYIKVFDIGNAYSVEIRDAKNRNIISKKFIVK